MAADFKSHVLLRDEKGFGGIPFKRLLLGAVSGGFAYTLFRLAAPSTAIPVGVIVAVLGITLTSLRGGLPLWLRLWLHLRGSLLLNATAHPTGVFLRPGAPLQRAGRIGASRRSASLCTARWTIPDRSARVDHLRPLARSGSE